MTPEFLAAADDAGLSPSQAAFLANHGFLDVDTSDLVVVRFICDVFEVTVAKAPSRIFRRFELLDEGRPVVATDAWSDIVAFVADGRRDFVVTSYTVNADPKDTAVVLRDGIVVPVGEVKSTLLPIARSLGIDPHPPHRETALNTRELAVAVVRRFARTEEADA